MQLQVSKSLKCLILMKSMFYALTRDFSMNLILMCLTRINNYGLRLVSNVHGVPSKHKNLLHLTNFEQFVKFWIN